LGVKVCVQGYTGFKTTSCDTKGLDTHTGNKLGRGSFDAAVLATSLLLHYQRKRERESEREREREREFVCVRSSLPREAVCGSTLGAFGFRFHARGQDRDNQGKPRRDARRGRCHILESVCGPCG